MASVFPLSRKSLAELLPSAGPTTAGQGEALDPSLLAKAAGAASLADSIRAYGHLAAQIDPLGNTPPGTPELTPEFHGITEADLASIPGSVLRASEPTAADAVARLRSLYSSNIGFEFDHLGQAAEREWLKSEIESGRLHQPLSADEKKAVLRRLTEVDGLERFLGRVYQGYKRFSIEGIDMMVPMLDTAIESAAAHGASEFGIAMAHRGRINVLAHILQKPYKTIFGEFAGKHPATNAESETGDVKYHLGFAGTRKVGEREVRVSLIPNPSHLEFANPILQGVARARQTIIADGGERDEASVVPVCIHGDAAFPGEGVVAETFNMSRLRGYRVGGTIHIIANNQVGFTTDPEDGALDALLERSRKGLRGADRSRECRGCEHVRSRHAAWNRVSREVRQGFPRRSRRISPSRSQRDRRACIHAAGDVHADQVASFAARSVGSAPR